MEYKYPNYETSQFEFLKDVEYNQFLHNLEMFKLIDDYIAPNVKLNMYAISSYGRVFNIRTGRQLAQVSGIDGHLSTGLQLKDSSRRTFYIHRLVALAFVPKTQEDILMGRDVVNHKDLCPWNNYYRNLEWTTTEENITNAYINGAFDKPYMRVINNNTHWSDGKVTVGEKNGMARLTNEQVHQICKSLEEGKSRKQACLDAGLQASQNDLFIVSHILQGQRHQDIASQYNLPKAKKITNYTEEQVHLVCKMLEEGCDSTEIYHKIKETDDVHNRHSIITLIRRITRKEIYTEISSNYKF